MSKKKDYFFFTAERKLLTKTWIQLHKIYIKFQTNIHNTLFLQYDDANEFK